MSVYRLGDRGLIPGREGFFSLLLRSDGLWALPDLNE